VIEGELEKGNKIVFRFGIEGFPLFSLRPRVGFNIGGGNSLFTTGLGARIRIGKSFLVLDYAINPVSEVGVLHWFTLSLERISAGTSSL